MIVVAVYSSGSSGTFVISSVLWPPLAAPPCCRYVEEPASLQVWHEDQWQRVSPVEHALTINVGDMMQVWSNDVYKAPLHRVLADRSRQRYSAPYFFNPSHSCDVAPIASGAPAEEAAR